MTDERGTNDLERKIEDLTKQKEYLQRQCRKAAQAIVNLEVDKARLRHDLERLQEEYNNYKIMKETK
jgi:chromosome segregation ATPase